MFNNFRTKLRGFISPIKASWDNKIRWKKNVILFYLDDINATSLKVIIGRSYMIKDILQRISEQNQTYCRYTIEIYIVYVYLKKDIFQRRREKVSWWSQKSSTNPARPSHVHWVTLQKKIYVELSCRNRYISLDTSLSTFLTFDMPLSRPSNYPVEMNIGRL